MDQTPIVLAHEKPFRVSAVEVRPATRELIRHGDSSIVEPRVMQMLVALHRAGGAVVSKDDLIRLCWEGRVVGEDAINRVVSRLRHDAEEKAGGAFKIETITKVGYRLVDGEGGATQSAGTPTINRRQALAAAGAVAVAGAGGTAWYVIGKERLPKRARELLENGRAALLDGTVDQYANAAASFRAAAEIAPDNAEILGALALAYARQADFAPDQQRSNLRARSVNAADRALSIDRDNGDAFAAKVGAVRMYRNWSAFEAENRRALEANPRHATLNAMLGSFLAQVGRNREALVSLNRAIEIEPNAVRFHFVRALALWDVGRLDEAEAAVEQAFRQWPRHYAIWFNRYYFLAHNGRAQEALAMISDQASRPIGIPDWNFELTRLQGEAAAHRDQVSVDRAMSALLEYAPRGAGFAENAIVFAGAMGRLDQAFAAINGYYFNRGFAVGEQRFAREQGMFTAPVARHTYILFRRLTASIRRDPRFGQLVDKLGLESYWRASRRAPDYRAAS